MSMIEKMSILGIRSFGPEDENQQVIEFQHPLTLLVGPNGAGKTTIIECLRYATTGDLPNNTQGGGFIHNPKLAKKNEIRSKVSLTCRNIEGDCVEVERHMKAIQKKGKVERRTFDSLFTKTGNKKTVSMSSKNIDLDSEMVFALGVSKPVLKNVIFCHQEEANWPFSQGSSVKQIFDDIFEATRYEQAVKEIRKIQKIQNKKITEEKANIKFLKINKERAEKCQKEYEKLERQLKIAKQNAIKATNELQPFNEKYKELELKRSEVMKLNSDHNSMKSRYQQMIEKETKLKGRIKHLFKESDSQFAQLQENICQIVKAKEESRNICEEKKVALQHKRDSLPEKKVELTLSLGKQKQKVEMANQQKQERDKMIVRCQKECNIKISGFYGEGSLTEEQVIEFEQSFAQFVNEEDLNLKTKKKQLDEENQKQEEELKILFQAKTKLAEKIKNKEENLKDITVKFNKNEADFIQLQAAIDKEQLLQNKLNKAKEELEISEKSNNVKQLTENINGLKQQKLQIGQQIEVLDSEIADLQTFERTKVNLMKQEKMTKCETIRKIKKKVEGNLIEAGLGTYDNFPNKLKVEKWIHQKDEEISKKQAELDSQKLKLAQYKTKQNIITEQIKEKQIKSEKLNKDLFQLCGSQDIDFDIFKLEADIKSLQDKKGLTNGIQYLYKEFLQNVQEDKYDCKSGIACPLCKRPFEETSKIDELVNEWRAKLELFPSKLGAQKTELESKQKQYQVLLANQPKKTEYHQLVNIEIPELVIKNEKLLSKISDYTTSVKVVENNLSLLNKENLNVKSSLPDVNHVDNLLAEVENIKKEIKKIELTILSRSSDKSLDQISSDRKTLSKKLKKINEDLEMVSQSIEDQKQTSLHLKNQLILFQAEKLQLATFKDLSNCEQFQKIQTALTFNLEITKKEIFDDKNKLVLLESEHFNLEKNQTEKKQLINETLNEMIQNGQQLQEQLREFQKTDKTVKQFKGSDISAEIMKVSREIDAVQKEIDSCDNEMRELTQKITNIDKELSTCAERQHDLDNNVALREQQKDIKDVVVQMQEMDEKLKEMVASKLEEYFDELNQQKQKLQKNEQDCALELRICEDRVKKNLEELNEKDIKFASIKYKDCLITLTTLELAHEDLIKYNKALAHAVIKYHQIKMEEINRIIRELWQETYCGKDIDYIKLESSDDTAPGAEKRVFNYRVVMHLGGTSMDMRGRCSAGQKVLASLVIRLALAETFCINCGILALDEPTTNLDKDNKKGLAKALISIIESRAGQRNFHLVIITHDEDFVDLLGQSNYVDHFYRIKKNDQGKSRIIKCRIRSLDS